MTTRVRNKQLTVSDAGPAVPTEMRTVGGGRTTGVTDVRSQDAAGTVGAKL